MTAVALWGAFWVVIIGGSAGTSPDASIVDGDPCCPTPDSWGEVVAWGGATVLLAAIVALALAIGASCLCFAVRARWPRPRSVVLVPGAAAVVACLTLVVAQTVQAVA